jgi:hypothetical protein
MHIDTTGLLYVIVAVPNDRWQQSGSVTFEEREVARRSGTDVYIEVIDTESGVLLASTGALSYDRALAEFPYGLFRRTRLGYRRADTPEGYPAVAIVTYQLLAR